MKKSIYIIMLLLACIAIYTTQRDFTNDIEPLSNLELNSNEAVSFINASMEKEAVFSLPQIFAVQAGGPVTCVVRGSFVDFHDSPGPSQRPYPLTWYSSGIPGFTSSGSNTLLKTVWIPASTTPGCYTVWAESVEGETNHVTFRVLASATDICTECLSPEGPGGPGIN